MYTSSSRLRPTAHVEKRPVPNMMEQTIAIAEDPHRLKKKLFTNPDRTLGSMPRQKEVNKLTKTGLRLAKAQVLMERVQQKCSTFNFKNDDDDSISVDIKKLAKDDNYMQCCVDIIQVMTLSDFRIPFLTEIIKSFPYPSCHSSCTALNSLGTNQCQLRNVTAKNWVILLAMAMLRWFDQRGKQKVLKMVHELYSQKKNLDWSELQRNPITNTLNEKSCRFALSLLGAKKARQLYRVPGKERIVGPSDNKISSSFLLNDVEAFSREQIRTKPKSAKGYTFMAWVSEQCPKMRSTNELSAAADSFMWYTKAYQVADVEGDDFISSTARIDASHCLISGGAGMIALGTEKGVVRRDFRSEFSAKAKELDNIDGHRKVKIGNACIMPFEIKCCTDQAHVQRVMESEKRRAMRKIPATNLELGDYCLVEWWEVRTLWNAAMKYYDKLAKIDMGFFVYGETGSWDSVAERLHHWTEVARLDMENEQYAQSNISPGIAAKRDKGRKTCAYCHKENEVKRCSKCLIVYYCSRECQKKDWKNHKELCKK